MKKFELEDKLALLIVAAGAFLRFYHFSDWSLSNDELSALSRLQFGSFAEMIEKGVRLNDMHPAGVQAFLWCWTHLAGTGEFFLRLPFVLMGVASVCLFYLTGRNFFGRFPALAASAVFAALAFPILYAQLARPYSPGLFFSLLLVYAWSNIVWKNVDWKWKDGMLFIAGGVGCIYSHYFSFLFAAIVGLSGLFQINPKARLSYLLCGVLMFLAYIPNLSVFITQFSIGGLGGPEGWLGPPGKEAIWNYLLYCFNGSPGLFLLLVLFSLFTLLRVKGRTRWSRKHSFAVFFFLLPALVAYFYSVLKNPVFQYSILLFSFPFIVLLMFSWLDERMSKPWQYFLPFLLLVVTTIDTVFIHKFYSTQFFAPFKEVAAKCAEYTKQYGRANSLATVNVINPDYIHYYSRRLPDSPEFRQYLCNRPPHFIVLKKLADSAPVSHFIHAWSNNYHAPEVEMILEEKFPYLVERDSFFNAGVLVYSKDSSLPKVQKPAPLFQTMNGFETLRWSNDSLFRTDSIASEGKWCIVMAPGQEYSPGIKTVAADLGFSQGAVYHLKCRFRGDEDLREVKGVVSVDRNGETILWRGVNFSEYEIEKSDWNTFYAGYKLVEELRPDDLVSVYFYNPAGEKVCIDEVRFTVLPW